MFEKTEKQAEEKNIEIENTDYEMYRKSKVGKLIQEGQEFFIADMKKKKIYSSSDLRLREIAEKVDSEDTFIFREARYTAAILEGESESGK